MSRIQINDITEVINLIENMRNKNKEINEIFMRLESSFGRLGDTWRDGEYAKAKKFINSAKGTVDLYTKESTEYMGNTERRLNDLFKDYTQSLMDSLTLDDLVL